MDTKSQILPKNLQEAADPDIYPATHVCFLVAKPTVTQSTLILPTHSKAQAKFLPKFFYLQQISTTPLEKHLYSPLDR